MLIDKNLTWKYHIDYNASKINRVVVCYCTIKVLRPFKYFNPNLPFSDFCIYLIWNCCRGSSCKGSLSYIYKNELFGQCSVLVVYLTLFSCLSPLMFCPSICSAYYPQYARHIYLCLRISVIFSPVHPTFIHITLGFLMMVTYMLINHD